MIKKNNITIIGGGLAGSECAYQLLKRGYTVKLIEMKPIKFTEAHKNPNFGELVCSNSLKSNDPTTAGGLLKEELRLLDSLVIKCADECSVPAGSALAVDREKFAELITTRLKEFPNLTIENREVEDLIVNDNEIVVIATGPLTSPALMKSLGKLLGEEYLYFFDAIAPIVSYDSIDFKSAFVADRYDKGTGDYINCPMTKEEYERFYNELINGEIVKLKDFENSKVFEGCMPVEVLAKRHIDALRFGPLKPVGLTNPHTGLRPYAVVQLRKETNNNDLYNLVGFQTNLTYPEQKRIFSLIPALKNAEFYRYGTMHKNSFVNAPKVLKNYHLVNHSNIYIAGQLSGVEGYIESIASGLNVALNINQYINGLDDVVFESFTMIGALNNYLNTASPEHFQPMSSNMGLINADSVRMKDKKEKNRLLSARALDSLKQTILDNNIKK